MPKITDFFMLVRLLLEDRKRLMLENLALRQQLAVLKRSVNRPRIEDSDRIFWILLRRMLKEWKDTLLFVKPDTVIGWHRRGFRHYWRRKSQSVSGPYGPKSRPSGSPDMAGIWRCRIPASWFTDARCNSFF